MSKQRTLLKGKNIEILSGFEYERVYWEDFDYSRLQYIMQRRQPGRGSNARYNDVIIMADTETSKKFKGVDGQPNHICLWTISLRAYHINLVTLVGYKPSHMIKCVEKLHDSMQGDRTLIFFHNLSYDYTFLRKFMFKAWGFPKKCLNTKPHYPISVLFDNGIWFRDSLCLSQRSLEKWASDLDVCHKKAVGYWDYDLTRNQDYIYSDNELTYAEHDTLAGVECLDKFMEAIGKNLTTLPYTATGVVRNHVQTIGKSVKAHDAYLRMCIKSWELLRKAMRCYHGGFTHANRYFIGKVVEGITEAYDEASAYPYVILTEKYPMEEYTKLDGEYNLDDIMALHNEGYSILMNVKMSNVRLKNFRHPMPTLQLSKAIDVLNPVIDNGRIITCDFISIDLTEINLCDVILKQYDYDYIEFDDIYIAQKDYLPRWFTDIVYDLYVNKCKTKNAEPFDPVLYDIDKSKVNCCYGMICQKPAPEDILEDYKTGEYYIPDEDDPEYIDPQKRLDKHNNKYNAVLNYAWGIYVCEHAFSNLMKIGSCCKKWIYSDTDSCYGQGWDKRKLAKYNQNCIKKMTDRGYPPVNINGKVYNLGVAELDGVYTEFKTLGAKRYCCRYKDSGELKLTVAGVPKKTGVKALNDDINNFHKDMVFPGSITGKKTHTFIYSDEIYIDEFGNETADSIDLSECDYTLDETNLFNWFFEGEVGEFTIECYDGGLIT